MEYLHGSVTRYNGMQFRKLIYEALPGFFFFWGGGGATGEKGHLFQGNGGTNAKCLGEQGNTDNIGEQGT